VKDIANNRGNCGDPSKMTDDAGTSDILKSIKDAQRNALMERAWKVAHEEMRRSGLSDRTIASGHMMAAMTLWQRELRKRGEGVFDRCWDALHNVSSRN
jgi:hypothetical protein